MFWFRWQPKKENNLLKHDLKQKFLTLCQVWYMLEQLLSIKLSSRRSLVGGTAPYCPQCGLGALPHAFALIMIFAVVCAHQEATLSPPRPGTPCEAGPAHVEPEPQRHNQPRRVNVLITAHAALPHLLKCLFGSPHEARTCHQQLYKPAVPKSKWIFHALDFWSQAQNFFATPVLLATNSHLLKERSK